jgi:hypothetical protein
MEGRISLFLPSVLLGFVAGAMSARRGNQPSPTTMAAMVAGSAVWLSLWVSQANLYDWPNGFEASFTGTGFCGDFSCAGQVFVTTPFVVSLAYVTGALTVAQRPVGRALLAPLVLAYLAAFTATWLWLSSSTQGSLYERHIYPYSRGRPAPPDLWPFQAASDEYRRLSPEVRRARAAAFHDSVLIELAVDNYFDPGPYRDTFISGSADAMLSITEDATGHPRQYRDLFGYSIGARKMPHRDLPRLTRDAIVIALAPAALLFSGLWLLIVWRNRARR